MLKVDNINSYYGKAHILHDAGFEITRGSVTALLGRNGAGKTTTLKSIMQMVRPHSGSVKFEDRNITGMPVYKVARLGIGYVPEERRIFSDLTVEENLEAGRQPVRDDAPGWTREQLFFLFPNLKERRLNRGKALSGGEQQMLAIARTLMGNPKLLLLDEPSEGIAPVIVEQMALTIGELKKQGMTVLISEQNLVFARAVADQAVIMESGHVRYNGPFSGLDEHPEISEKYLSI